ncbi:MAG: hypothetical protein ABIF10_05520 [Candidatus Woesearchaeota archaeon]
MVQKSYDDPVKDKWRDAWSRFIKSNKYGLAGSPNTWKVASFLGAEAFELRIYDLLGIPRGNITALESDPNSHQILKQSNLGIRLTPEPLDALDFFRETNDVFDICMLDYNTMLKKNVLDTIRYIAGRQLLAENSLLGIAVYGQREQQHVKNHYVGGVFGSEVIDEIPDIFSGNISLGDFQIADYLKEKGYKSFKSIKDRGLTKSLEAILGLGRSNLSVSPMFQRNPEFQQFDKDIKRMARERGVEFESDADLHSQGNVWLWHMQSLMQHIIDCRIGVGMDAWFPAICACWSESGTYFTQQIERYEYVSRSGSLMLSDLFQLSKHSKRLEKYQYLADHAYQDLNLLDYGWAIIGKPKSAVSNPRKILEKKLQMDVSILWRSRKRELEERIFLGSSARLPSLAGEQYYKQRFEDDSAGVSVEGTWKNLSRNYNVGSKQLSHFESSYIKGDYGPKCERDVVDGRPENNLKIDISRIIPDKYYDRLPENRRQRLSFFINDDLPLVSLDKGATDACLDEIKGSRWYRDARVTSMTDLQFYAFFDDVLLKIRASKVILHKEVMQTLDSILKPGWNRSKPEPKPFLTLEIYERSVGSGMDDNAILDMYRTQKPNSLRSYKAWLTMKQGRQEPENVGVKVINLLRQGRTKQEVMDELKLKDYQFRGFLAAFKRGAYKNRLANVASKQLYVDSHGVAHAGKFNVSQIENGYK